MDASTPSPAAGALPGAGGGAGRKAIFLDVDGTIMKDGVHIPALAAKAIRAARANGHLVFLSTGRGMAELQGELMDIGFDGAVSNGGAFASIGDEIVSGSLLTADEVARLREYFSTRGIHGYFQSHDQMFASPGAPRGAVPSEVVAGSVSGSGCGADAPRPDSVHRHATGWTP